MPKILHRKRFQLPASIVVKWLIPRLSGLPIWEKPQPTGLT